jgi:hypothetical protein
MYRREMRTGMVLGFSVAPDPLKFCRSPVLSFSCLLLASGNRSESRAEPLTKSPEVVTNHSV